MKGRDLTRDGRPRVVLLATRPPLSQLGVVTDRWKLIHWQESGMTELFDVLADPGEGIELSRQQPAVVDTLMPILERWPAHASHLIENYTEVLATRGRRCETRPAPPSPR